MDVSSLESRKTVYNSIETEQIIHILTRMLKRLALKLKIFSEGNDNQYVGRDL